MWKKSRPLHSERYAIFRTMLVQLRKEAGLTQVELAVRLSTTQAFVSKYEMGGRRIDLPEFVEIAGALGVEPQEFLIQYQKAVANQLG
jgi:transcriptional regulator with XRE-family HTH domain